MKSSRQIAQVVCVWLNRFIAWCAGGGDSGGRGCVADESLLVVGIGTESGSGFGSGSGSGEGCFSSRGGGEEELSLHCSIASGCGFSLVSVSGGGRLVSSDGKLSTGIGALVSSDGGSERADKSGYG